MLMHLSIQHLAVVEQLALNIQSGMTVLTGETGAGKSILIDALQLALGNRAESGIVRHNCSHAEISAVFELTNLPAVGEWLKEHTLEAEDECIIRRTLTEDGRSRAYINGRVVPISQLRELGEKLVNIHGQHQHQSLLKAEHQRGLLDAYAIAAIKDAKKTKSNQLLFQHEDLLKKVKENYFLYQTLLKEYQKLLSLQGQNDKLTLLQYQIQEIDELGLAIDELPRLEAEHKHLAHAEQWLLTCEAALSALKNDANQDAATLLYQGFSQVSILKTQSPLLTTAHELLNTAYIQLTEAIVEIENFKETLSSDPNRLLEIDTRLTQIHALARKHRIQPEAILEHKKMLESEAGKLQHIHTHLETITQKLADAEKAYQNAATELSNSRQKAASLLEKQVTVCIQTLEMPNGHFKIAFAESASKIETKAVFSAHGIDEVEFLVSTNPGLALQPLRKIASGGELSRISLAIQVITTQKQSTPTLIFDEVDAGISGKTAETVGKLLRQLSKDAQVLCITHLPQIAVQGHHHFNVLKKQTKDSTTTTIIPLGSSERIQELARMLGGAVITERTLAHAKEMLEYV
ncbi:MAG TPA: DNA repair protein RecN [Gammaproteobacteria bacterium]|nr:DNA repair protein RecN [Gammaproteobacteria bacterium]